MQFKIFLEELKKLGFPPEKFAIFGSGPMAVRGLRDVNDIDIIVKDDIWAVLLKDHTPAEKNGEIKIGNISIFNQLKPWFDDINPLIDTADVIDGIKYVRLEYLIKWKKIMNREKDQKDIKLIEEYLKNQV
jgi:hypothetical protein